MESDVDLCSSKQPMYCSSEGLAQLYKKSASIFPSHDLANSPEMEIIDGYNWSFDPSTLTIWNNRYWKGFYPLDYEFTNLVLMYGFGFCKRFLREDDQILGETHPFYSDIHAANRADDVEFPEMGKAILIEYRDFPFNAFDDLIKLVEKDVALGQAYVAIRKAPNGIPLFNFALSRRYSVDFMTQADCKFIFSSKARKANIDEVLGEWDLRLVSDSALSPPILRLKYYKEQDDLRVGYILGGELPMGSSIASFDQEMIDIFDLPGQVLRNEIRMVKEDFMVGVLYESDSPLFKAIEGTRGFVMKDDTGMCLPYTLKRVS
jgi:hypothetical protein